MTRCTARSKTTGDRCRQPVVAGSTKCRFHGGKSLAGAAHPNYRTGRYVDVLPLRLRERFERALGDPDLLSMSPEVAAVDARLGELLGQVSEGGSAAAWAAVRRAWDDYQDARAQDERDLVDDALQRLEDAIARGWGDEAAWRDVLECWEARRKFVESERKRMIDAQLYVDVGHLAQVFAVLAESLHRNVRDVAERQAVVLDMRRLLGRGGQRVLDGAGAPHGAPA